MVHLQHPPELNYHSLYSRYYPFLVVFLFDFFLDPLGAAAFFLDPDGAAGFFVLVFFVFDDDVPFGGDAFFLDPLGGAALPFDDDPFVFVADADADAVADIAFFVEDVFGEIVFVLFFWF